MAVHPIDDRTTVDSWAKTARIAGLTAATAIFLQSGLFLLDATGILPFSPDFRETSAGREQDLATFYARYFERQHDVAWNIAPRDLVSPVAAIAIIVLARALVRLRGRGRAQVEVWALVLAVGAAEDVVRPGVPQRDRPLEPTAFTTETPGDVIALGRSTETIDRLSSYPENTAYLVLAVSLVGLVAALGQRRLALLARVLAVCLVVLVVAWWSGWDLAYQIAALATGVLLAPRAGRWPRAVARPFPSALGRPVPRQVGQPQRAVAQLGPRACAGRRRRWAVGDGEQHRAGPSAAPVPVVTATIAADRGRRLTG